MVANAAQLVITAVASIGIIAHAALAAAGQGEIVTTDGLGAEKPHD
jgi:hypothetical protein